VTTVVLILLIGAYLLLIWLVAECGSTLSNILDAIRERDHRSESDELSKIESTLDNIESALQTIDQRLERILPLMENVSQVALRHLAVQEEPEIRQEILTYLTEHEKHVTVATLSEVLLRQRGAVDKVLATMAEAGEIVFSAKRRSVSLPSDTAEKMLGS
jgi:hypothetical protein